MNDTEKLWDILMKNVDWIKFSDTKATVVLTTYGIIITLVYTNPNAVLTALNESGCLKIITIITGLISLISIYFSFKCLNPRLKNNNPSSIIYFGHVKEKFETHLDYLEEFKSVINTKDKYNEQIAEQIHMTSKIAWRKFYDVSWSIRLLIATIGLLLIEILIYLGTASF